MQEMKAERAKRLEENGITEQEDRDDRQVRQIRAKLALLENFS